MERRELKPGEIVQIDPAQEDERGRQWFGGCLMVVSECRSWGAQGYVQNAGQEGQAYYRCKWAHMEPTGGMAPWVIEGTLPVDPKTEPGPDEPDATLNRSGFR